MISTKHIMCRASTVLREKSHLVFFNDTATTEIYTLSLHDALPIFTEVSTLGQPPQLLIRAPQVDAYPAFCYLALGEAEDGDRSEEHTSELQSRQYIVCRLLLEKQDVIIVHSPYIHSAVLSILLK